MRKGGDPVNFHMRRPLSRERCIRFDITDPTPWEYASSSVRCPVCRCLIGEEDEVMCADGYGKEVILHFACSERCDLSPADLIEILGLSASYGTLGDFSV